jgi:hypothetical protein
MGTKFSEDVIPLTDLKVNPGRIVPEFDQPFLRELIRPPFRIVYRRDPKHVRVVRVWRSERLLGATHRQQR